jgi:hypothetical protein
VTGDWTIFTLAQPGLRRMWQLSRGDEAVAVLRRALFRSGAQAEIGDRRLAIERRGHLRSECLVRDEATGELLARLHPEGRRRLVEIGGRVGEWKRLGRKEGHGFVDRIGTPFLRGKVKSGLVHTNGEIETAPDLPEDEAIVLALLAAYLLLRKAEEDAAAAGAAVTTTSA